MSYSFINFHFSDLSFSTINRSDNNFVTDDSNAETNYSQITIQLSDLVSEKSQVTGVTIKPLKPSRIPKSKIPIVRKIKPVTSTVKTKMDTSFSDPKFNENMNQPLDPLSPELHSEMTVFQKVQDVHQQDSPHGPAKTYSHDSSRSDKEIPKDFSLKSQKTKMFDQKISEPEVLKNQIKGENKLSGFLF